MFRRYCIQTPRKMYVFAVPKLIRLSQMAFIDYVGEGKEIGLVEDYVKNMRGQHRFDVYKSPDNRRCIIILVAAEKAEFERLRVLVDNIPDKISALYGEDERDAYLDEAQVILKMFNDLKLKKGRK